MLPFSDAVKWSAKIVCGVVIVCDGFVALKPKLPKRRQETVFAFLTYKAIVSIPCSGPSNYQVLHPALQILLSTSTSSSTGCNTELKKDRRCISLYAATACRRSSTNHLSKHSRQQNLASIL